MKTREGLIPTVLGTVVAATGVALYKSKPVIASGVAGFGLAHVLLGGIDLVGHRKK